jgi:hypothetical protein
MQNRRGSPQAGRRSAEPVDGTRWRCPPGETYAAPLALNYTVRSSHDINWIFQENIQFLEDYFRGTACVASATVEKVRAHVAALPEITLDELLASVAVYCSRDEIYFLIAQGHLCIDLWSARLSEPGTVKVLSNSHLLPAPPEIPRTSPTTVPESSPDAELLQRILKASEDELRRANHRYDCVCRFLRGNNEGLSVPMRTLRRWAAGYRDAERRFGSGFLGLLSNAAKRGNSRSKLPEATASLMAEFIKSDYETLKQWPALGNPANLHRAEPLTPEQFHYAFTNTLDDQESLAAYNRHAVPGPDHVLFQMAFANFNPNAATAVDFNNDTRAPLLLNGGRQRSRCARFVVHANFNLFRKSKAVTEYHEGFARYMAASAFEKLCPEVKNQTEARG